jgi:hypothetical protein
MLMTTEDEQAFEGKGAQDAPTSSTARSIRGDMFRYHLNGLSARVARRFEEDWLIDAENLVSRIEPSLHLTQRMIESCIGG